MEERERKTLLTRGSLVGLITNFLLFIIKCTVGTLSGSVAVIGDAFNNLSDMGSGAVTLLGFRLSEKPSDEEHPFGHGRIEYISGLLVSFLILFLGVELLGSAARKILHPETLHISALFLILLSLSVPAKLFLWLYMSRLGKKIGSVALSASGRDSLNDVLVTLVTIFSCAFSSAFGLPLDGYMGLAVSLFVLWSGIGLLKETLGPLLGQAPPRALVSEIESRIRACPGVTGTHDLIVHNYGPGRFIASVHAEVRADCDILKIHDAIDLAERKVLEELGVLITAHLDPIATDDALTHTLQAIVCRIAAEIDASLSIHDFRVVSGDTHTNLIFDLVVPHRFSMSNSALSAVFDAKLKMQNPSYFAVITFDRAFH